MCFLALVVGILQACPFLLLPTTQALDQLEASQLAKQDCNSSCGNVTIPYPFGMNSPRCYLNENFLINCPNSTPFLRHSDIQVTNITTDGQLSVLAYYAAECFDSSTKIEDSWWASLKLSKFKISKTNKFTVIGCDSYGYLRGTRGDKNYSSGCITTCYNSTFIDTSSCSGSGCCQMEIPDGLQNVNIQSYRFFNDNRTLDFNPCTYAFIVDQTFNFSTRSDLLKTIIPTSEKFPVALNWAIDDDNSSSSLCKDNSFRESAPDNMQGYICRCNPGYQGNPYLPQGCQDIKECQKPELNDCIYQELCHNTLGNYTCSCPKGYHGDGRKQGQRCTANEPIWRMTVVGVSVAISALLMVCLVFYCGIQKRNINKCKERLFIENGGLVMKEVLSNIEESTQRVKIFIEDELKKATNNFDKNEIIGQGGFGTVYKGKLDQTIIAIKMPKVIDPAPNDQFIDKMIVLSQINHPNVVRLIGCCLETPVPILVYEFIRNKDLNYHLHNDGLATRLSWKIRLRIAVETAGALAHMHSDAPIRIIHGDVKSSNILLDDNFTAKVSDFGISRLVPSDQTQVCTVIQGTCGYMDPEYFQSGLLNDKSDVYGFGVILVELLTREKALFTTRPANDKNLATFFTSALKDDCLFRIIDQQVKKEGDPEQIKSVAKLAKQCLEYRGEKRPSMKQVTRELQEMITISKGKHIEVVIDSYDTPQPLLPPSIDFLGTTLSIGPYSMRSQEMKRLVNGQQSI
ncbi:hypothetical protein K2173_026890 [Erythroxylum novogranatense]|uniref:Uncharacterized protein n=1 Tax=Erythroxylum novogranatense TaxID=1862640 RepID=A0AAV8U014_9ROSI|nr:hypothetical protein K2173_026890 [Erythroxylum novogranatense]